MVQHNVCMLGSAQLITRNIVMIICQCFKFDMKFEIHLVLIFNQLKLNSIRTYIASFEVRIHTIPLTNHRKQFDFLCV